MEALGINLSSLLFQVLNFVVLFFLLTKLLSKPILKLLDTRRKEIEEGLKNAEEAKRALAEAEERQVKMLADADRQGHELIEQVRLQAKQLEKELQEATAARVEKLFENAEAEIAAERVRLKSELRGELADMVVTATGKVLQEKITLPEKKAQIEKIVTSMK